VARPDCETRRITVPSFGVKHRPRPPTFRAGVKTRTPVQEEPSKAGRKNLVQATRSCYGKLPLCLQSRAQPKRCGIRSSASQGSAGQRDLTGLTAWNFDATSLRPSRNLACVQCSMHLYQPLFRARYPSQILLDVPPHQSRTASALLSKIDPA
jgi:hypothetical protein